MASIAIAAMAATPPPRTPDGQPDLQGTWTDATITPFERPDELAGKQVLTPAEAAAVEKKAALTRVDAPPKPGDVGNYNFMSPYCHEAVHGVFLSILALVFLSDWLTRKRLGFAIAAGFCIGLVFLTKPEAFAAIGLTTAGAFAGTA